MDIEYGNEKIQIEKDGKIVDCDVLFTFDSEDTMKCYIGYTDHSMSSDGRKNIYVSSYNPLNPDIVLEDITDPLELDMVREVLEKIDEASNN